MVYKRSTDSGKSWSKLQTLLDPVKLFPNQCPADHKSVASEDKSCEFWDPTPIVDKRTGTVFMMTSRSWAHDGQTNQGSRMNALMDMWLLRSTDIGAVSSPPDALRYLPPGP